MKPILVSACLLGAACKYSGGDNLCSKVAALAETYPLVPPPSGKVLGLSPETGGMSRMPIFGALKRR